MLVAAQVALVAGGAAGARALRGLVRSCREEQSAIARANVAPAAARKGRPPQAVQVDSVFLGRLLAILRM
jgi:hypothetical protein